MNITLNSIIKILVVIVILLVVIPIALYFALGSKLATKNDNFSDLSQNATSTLEGQQNVIPAELSGKIFLSLLPKDSDRTALPFSYVYDVKTKELKLSDLDLFDQSLRTYVSDLSFSPNGEWVGFKGIKPNDVETNRWQDWDYSIYPQMYRYRLAPGTDISDELGNIRTNSEKLTDLVANRKQLSSINNNGGILMVSVDSSDDTAVQPVENYTIRYVDPNKQVSILTKGFAPTWINEDYFIFLKKDGLYTYSIRDSKENLMVGVTADGVGFSSNVKMNASNDGRFVAVPVPSKNITMIIGIDVIDKKPVTTGFLKEISVGGFWPTFSPDGEFLVIQGVDVDNIATDPKPFLSFWRTSDFTEIEARVSLDDYLQDYMFIDDWIK